MKMVLEMGAGNKAMREAAEQSSVESAHWQKYLVDTFVSHLKDESKREREVAEKKLEEKAIELSGDKMTYEVPKIPRFGSKGEQSKMARLHTFDCLSFAIFLKGPRTSVLL